MTDHDPDVHEQRLANEQPDGMAPLRTLDGQTIYELPYRREGSTVHLGWSTATELAEVRAAAERAAARDLYSRMELGKTQRGLAASQADLTRVEKERDRANSQVEVELIKLANVRELWREERAELERERQESGRLRRELEQLGDIVHRCSACSAARHA